MATGKLLRHRPECSAAGIWPAMNADIIPSRGVACSTSCMVTDGTTVLPITRIGEDFIEIWSSPGPSQRWPPLASVFLSAWLFIQDIFTFIISVRPIRTQPMVQSIQMRCNHPVFHLWSISFIRLLAKTLIFYVCKWLIDNKDKLNFQPADYDHNNFPRSIFQTRQQ